MLFAAGFAMGLPARGFAADEIHWTLTGRTAVTIDWRGSETAVRYGVTKDLGQTAKAMVQTQPFSFHDQNPESDAGLSVTVPGPDLRLNMGVRVFLDSEVDITVMRNGQVLVDKIMPVQGDILLFTTANAFIGTELQAGDQVFLRVRGDGLPLYTLTDNSTNDPALFFPPTPIQIRVDKAFIVD